MLHKFKITSYAFILCSVVLLFMTVSPGSAKEEPKGPKWLQDEKCQDDKPSKADMIKYNFRRQSVMSELRVNRIWCRPVQVKQRDAIKKVKKKFVPDCIKTPAYEKVRKLVHVLSLHGPSGACPPPERYAKE